MLEARTVPTAGLLDPSFGVAGVLTNSTTFPPQAPTQVAALPDGGLVVAGLSSDAVHFQVARYNADGSPVTAFGNNGVAVLGTISLANYEKVSLALWYNPTNHDDVRIVLAGTANFDFVVVRLNLDSGNLDPTFNGTGQQTIDFGNTRPNPNSPGSLLYYFDIASAVAVSPDGKISVAGFGANFGGGPFPVQVARLNSNGSLDITFDGDGKEIGPANAIPEFIERPGDIFLALQPDAAQPGKTKMVITKENHDFGGDPDTEVWRLNDNGSFDSTFDGDGKKIIHFGSGPENGGDNRSTGVAVQWDGKIVVACDDNSVPTGQATVIRLNNDGSFDTSFNGNGKSTIDIEGRRVTGVALAGDGAIVLAATASTSQPNTSHVVVARLKTDGSLDAHFGVAGKATFGVGAYSFASRLAIDFDDRIVVTGGTFDATFTNFNTFLARIEGYGLSVRPYAVSIAGTAGDDTITIDQVSGTGALRVTVNGSPTDYDANSDEVFIAGLGGNDTFTVNAALASGLLIDGGDGADTYTVNLGNLSGTVLVLDDGANSGTGDTLLVNGTTSSDTLYKANGAVQWRPSGSNGPVLEAVTFSGMEHVTLNGAAGNDTFHDPGQDTTILGGPGDDTIIIEGTTGSGVVVDGGDGSDTYIVATGALGGPVAIADSGATGTDTLSVQGTSGDDTITVISSGLIVNGATITVGAGLESVAVDGGGGADSFTVQGTLPVPVVFQNDQNGVSDLTVYGTSGNDAIVINPGGAGSGVTVNVNGTSLGTFNPTGRIIVYGLAGDDDIQVAGGVTLPVWLYGGDGNDRLKGGDGANVLEGGAGDDLLVGGKGRDLLVGGGGADRLIGNGGDDILIGGYTSYDALDAALTAIMAEWTSNHDYATRIANLTDTGSGLLSRLNANYFLIQDQTVFNDASKDTLTGSAGSDWFFAGAADKITDLSAADQAFIFV